MNRPLATLTLALFALLGAHSAGGCAQIRPSSLWHRATNRALEARPLARLTVESATDARPELERTGSTPKTKAFIFIVSGAIYSERGNHVTSDAQLGGDPMAALTRLTRVYLRRSRVVDVVAAPHADLVLRTRVHHLVAARFSAQTIVVAGSKNDGSATATGTYVPMVANAIATFELVRRRSGRETIVWRRTLSGVATATELDAKPAQEAVGRLMMSLAGALRVALTELASRAPVTQQMASSSPTPALADAPFVVQRVLPGRESVELLTLLPDGREVVRQELPLTGIPESATDDWVLSHRTSDGKLLGAAGYRALARRLATTFDLRKVDDLRHYHFFGKKRALSLAQPAPR